MRHRIHHRKLNRTSEHRTAMFRNLAQSLIEHGRVTTTVPKAKDLRPFFERLVTLAVRVRKHAATDDAAALRARRALHKVLGDRSIVPKEYRSTYNDMPDAQRAKTMRMASGRRYRTGEPKGRLAFTAESVTHRLIESIAPRYEDRPGGYTRVVLLPDRRVGDHAPLAMVQLVGDEEAPGSLTKPARSARRRKADARYAMAVKAAKQRAKAGRPSKQKADEASEKDASPVTTAVGADAEAQAETNPDAVTDADAGHADGSDAGTDAGGKSGSA